MPVVEKTKKANYGMYATLDSLILKTRPILNAHGLAIIQFPASSPSGEPVLRTILCHESGEQVSADMPLFVVRQDMQQLGSAITYAKRYAWSAALGIAADDDDDGTAASPANQPGATQAQTFTAPELKPELPPDGEFRFASGAHQGKTLSEAPRSYIEWCVSNHPKPDVREMCGLFLGLTGVGAGTDDSIPFEPSVDGLGG